MATSTRKKATEKGKGARREVTPRAVYERSMPSVRFGWEHFRFRLLRTRRKLPPVWLDGLATAAGWTSSDKVAAMTLGVQLPPGGGGGTAGAAFIAEGDEIRCDVDANGNGRGWKELWLGVVQAPIPHTLGEGTYSVALKPAEAGAADERVAWKFRKDKANPEGWTASRITRRAAKRFRMKVGSLPRATHPIVKLVEKKASVQDVVEKAWKEEREATGRRFVVDWIGTLTVRELREPAYMRVLGPSIIAATVDRSLQGVYSAAIVVGSRKVAGKRKAYRVKVVNSPRQRKYGYIVRTVTKNGLSSAAARRYARDKIVRAWRTVDTITLTHPGIPWVRKGDATMIELEEDGISQLAYVRAAEHSVSPDSYDMELEVAYADPWEDARKERVKAAKAAAARKRKRAGGGDRPARAKAAKAERRS